MNACSSRNLFCAKLLNVSSSRSANGPVATVATICRDPDIRGAAQRRQWVSEQTGDARTLRDIQSARSAIVNQRRNAGQRFAKKRLRTANAVGYTSAIDDS